MNILGKIHINRSRHNPIIPSIHPITPIKRQPPPHIINHASKKSDLPPFRHMFAPCTSIRIRLSQLILRSLVLGWSVRGEQVEAVAP